MFRHEHARETPPTWWPARPTRCSPEATDGGASTWITRSTAPMSMPSSSEDVATIAGSSPRFSRSSIAARFSRATEPWCASAISSPGEIVERVAQPLGEATAVDEDHRRAMRPHERDDPRVKVRPNRMRAAPAAPARGSSGTARRQAPTCRRRAWPPRGRASSAPRVDDARSGASPRPPRKRAVSSSGFCVADSPMRWKRLRAFQRIARAARATRRDARRASCPRADESRRR